jgi:hypothetical protein
VGLQPAGPGLLMLAHLPLPVGSPIGLLGGHLHRHLTHGGGLPVAATRAAKHPGGRPSWRVSRPDRLGKGLVGVGAASSRPLKLPGPIARGLVQQAAQPVAFGPQLGSGQPPQVQAAGGVDGQRLLAGARERLGELVVAVAGLPVGQVQLHRPLGLRPDDRVQGDLMRGA